MPEDILNLPAPAADHRIAYGPDPNHFVDFRVPRVKPPRTGYPLAINIHGGFWRARYDLTHAGHLCAALTTRGLLTANLEYRRVGNPGGGWPGTFSDICQGCDFVIHHAQGYTIDPARIVIMGHSAGGQLALCLAARRPQVKAVISLAGVVNLRRAHELHLSHDAVVEFLGGSPTEVPDRYREADPMRFSVKGVEQILFHGSADEIVPPEFSRDYAAHKNEEGEMVRLVEIPGVGHDELIDPRSAAWMRVEEALLRLLQ